MTWAKVIHVNLKDLLMNSPVLWDTLDALATCSATVSIYCLRRIVDFIVLLLFGTGCVDGSGSLSGGAFNQLKLVTLSIV